MTSATGAGENPAVPPSCPSIDTPPLCHCHCLYLSLCVCVWIFSCSRCLCSIFQFSSCFLFLQISKHTYTHAHTHANTNTNTRTTHTCWQTRSHRPGQDCSWPGSWILDHATSRKWNHRAHTHTDTRTYDVYCGHGRVTKPQV